MNDKTVHISNGLHVSLKAIADDRGMKLQSLVHRALSEFVSQNAVKPKGKSK
jgi:hypothetical protein